MPKCFLCSETIESFKIFRSHIRRHNIEKNDFVFCVESNCGKKQFRNLSTLIRHLKNCHKFKSQHEAPCVHNYSEQDPLVEMGTEEVSDTADDNQMDQCDDEPENLVPFLRNEVDIFLSKLYENPRVPRKEVQNIVSYTQNLLQGIGAALKPSCLQLLSKANASPGVEFEWEDIFSYFENPFEDLRSEHIRLKTFKKEGTYIEPITILLGAEANACTSKGEHTVEMEPLTAHFIPLRVTLQKFLTQPEVMTTVIKFIEEVRHGEIVLSNFMSAEAWATSDSNGKFFLPLFLYGDEFECGNALGSHKTIHKITGMYVSMPFLPPELTFRLQNIFIVYLFHSLDRGKFSSQKLYQCLIEEFTYLYNEGISIVTPSFNGTVYFKLSLLLGDNLGLHQMLGFIEGFTANFPCRICKIFRDNMRQQCEDNMLLWRNPHNYDLDVAVNSKSDTGVSEPCVWNQIPAFHCTQSSGFDIMHDLLEGCCLFSLKVLIGILLKEKIFKLDTLNNRIKYFDYGLIDRDSKPTLLTIDKGKIVISMSAAEMLIFMKYFGLLFGDLVPEEHEAWELYILLRKILDIVMSPLIPIEHTKLLSIYIMQHHQLYLTLCEDRRLKNKMHHMIHYPKLIQRFGPPIYFWSMRYEAKHRFPKSIAVSISNNRNVTLSIANRAQLAFHSCLKNNSFVANQFLSGPSRSCKLCDVPGFRLIENVALPAEMDVQTVSWAKVKGTTFKTNMILVTGHCNHLPVFAQIKTILLTNSDSIAFMCLTIDTINFDSHFFAFEVMLNHDCYQFIELKKLPHDFPTVMSTAAGKLFITYKYGI